MFSPLGKSPLSVVKGQKHIKPSPYFSPSLRKSLNISLSRNSPFGRSFSNSVLEDANSHLIECYGSTLPVLVTEAITIADNDIKISCQDSGIHCKELTLPPSDLAHKAELVHLFQTEESRLPSALAVSPEGHVRYWPNINHEGSSVDAQPHLQGQECCSLSSIYPLGCILATTSSSLIIITPTIGDGQPNVICRTLTLPQGVLAGIGRKVSSFIFGVIPAQTTETKQLNRVLSAQTDDGDYFLYVLSNSCVQKWHIAKKDKKENYDQLLFEVDLDRELKQIYTEELFSNDTNAVPGLKTWCLDMQLYQSGVMILTACTIPVSPGGNVHYGFGFLDTSSIEQAQTFSSFNMTTHTKLICQFAYIYNSEKVLCIPIVSPQIDYNTLDFSSTGNAVLGSGSCEGMPLFFTRDYGIISFLPSQKAIGDSKLLASMKDVSIRKPDVISDPRWCESVPSGSVSSSLLISYQLEDKQNFHECLLVFLKTFHLFEKLTTVKMSDFRIPTKVLLCEHAEKLVAAKSIRLFLTEHGEIIETAVRETLERRDIEVKNHLTPQDVFFREVSAFHTVFPSLIELEKDHLNSDESLEKTLSAVMTMNKIFVGLLEAINEYRQNRLETYDLKDVPVNYMPWTSRDGHSGIRPFIRNQLDINVTYALNLTDNIQIQGVLFQQYVEILDFFLNSYEKQMQSLKKSERNVILAKEYALERQTFLRPLISVRQYERAGCYC
ncbi:nuclear pore complex protein Nup133 [Trichonephila inaurata madagascariensis]|uniref:Nuclear pore complex protein Nup133 n=1 Tax=Trichonephila inaurata madagascariensis TaxID=2747483 RepID=A0A8X7CK46_9ARAC|nr:nuclear pore complex protein Nup133 [Trichonephila inaurata madagascariensis]